MRAWFVFFYVVLISFGKPAAVNAQSSCINESYINPYFNCQEYYHPVCACDGKTYFSPCSAINHAGVISGNWSDGICEPFWFYIPSITNNASLRFSMQFQKNGGSAILLITDVYGKIHYQRLYNRNNDNPVHDEFDISILKQGVYILNVLGNSHKQTQKFSVIQY